MIKKLFLKIINKFHQDRKGYISIFILAVLLFGGSWLCRRHKAQARDYNKYYAFSKIFKHVWTLKNSTQYYYNFQYKDKKYEGYKSENVKYDINIGDYFLVLFSSTDPDNNEILYKYKLKKEFITNANYNGDTIPLSILEDTNNGRSW